MQRDKLREVVREELARIVEDSDLILTDATTADNVKGWDSFNHLKLLFSLESRLDLHFDVADIADPTNVGDLLDLLQRKLAAA